MAYYQFLPVDKGKLGTHTHIEKGQQRIYQQLTAADTTQAALLFYGELQERFNSGVCVVNLLYVGVCEC